MDLTQISLSEFLCKGNTETKPVDQNAFEFSAPALNDLIGEVVHSLDPDYSIHEITCQPGDVVLVHNCKLVGFYWGEVIAIQQDHQGKKLSVPLILSAIGRRPLPEKRILSEPGRKALEKAWRVANGCEPNPWP